MPRVYTETIVRKTVIAQRLQRDKNINASKQSVIANQASVYISISAVILTYQGFLL